jgi:hypothetical protein
MGFWETTYKVLHNDGSFFDDWNVAITNLTLKEAENYVKEKTGFFKEPASKSRIEKE